ncbi:MAG: hypothetical protein F2667_09945, partial [Actinobacteria bacterium]|nr:hypothetical protein [Actinomycetota bacterium]
MDRPSARTRARRALTPVRQVVRLMAQEPGLVRDLAIGTLPEPLRRLPGLARLGADGGPPSARPEGAPAHVVPAELDAHLRTVSAETVLDADPAQVLAAVADLALQADWLTLHAAWRGAAPAYAVEGATYGQQLKIMGIPAEVVWTVRRSDDDLLVLEGVGPMGLTLALAVSIAPHSDQTRVMLDAGLSGDPVKGPLGASVSRSIAEALSLSLTGLGELLAAGDGAGAGSGRPVLHHATGTRLDPRTPVIVGVGQV